VFLGRGERGTASVAYAARVLRFVGPWVWLGAALASRVDAEALEPIADVRRERDGLAIRLREPATADDLARALKAVLAE
jgi:hypothetical protein